MPDIADALRAAHWPSLIPVLGALTGEPGRFAHLIPAKLNVLDAQGGMSADQQRAAHDAALEVLAAYLRDELTPPPVDEPLARGLLAPLLGSDLDAYFELATEEVGLLDPDPRAPRWRHAELAPDVPLTVAVIGAGMSGLLAAHRLHQAGLRVVVFEKNADLGGTWWENTYPNCRVDVPSHLYTYSCDAEVDWTQHFAPQPEIHAAFGRFAACTGVERLIRFGTEVEQMVWDGSAWQLGLVGGETFTAQIVVNAVGQLNRPSIPDVPGRDAFRGTAFHTARWNHDAEIDGKRVAVIGTGASGMQVVPPLAQRAGHLTIFQRTPAWPVPTPDLLDEVDPRLRWLFSVVPGYQRWYRFWLLRRVSDALLPFATVDPAWDGGEGSVSYLNDRVRIVAQAYLEREFAGRPDLLAKVVPSHPPFSKRSVRDDGAWARTLRSDHVDLVTEPIIEITPGGVRTGTGVHRADVLVWGTGFHASRFLHPMRVHGRDSLDLHQVWDGEPSAYLGMTVPGFPNMFMLYGPNTNIVVNGSAVYFSECQVRHLLACLELYLERGGTPIEVSTQAHDDFRKRTDEASALRAWSHRGVRSWYKSASGRVSQNWPGTVLEYWRLTRTADPADYPLVP